MATLRKSRLILLLFVVALLATVASVAAGASLAVAQGQVPPATNIEVREGSQPGEVIVSWDAVLQATYYRIGYVNMEVDYHFAKGSCTEEWIEAFVYVDVNARNIPVDGGRAEYTVRRLDTGARHAFTVLTSNSFYNNRENVGADFSWPQNPRWRFLPGRDTLPPGVTIPDDECAAAAVAGQVAPTRDLQITEGGQSGEVTISWDAVPQATHYRIGYVNMEVDYHFAKASCTEEWIEAFVYVDVNARNFPVNNGRVQYTVRRLDTGARHAFTVLTSNNFYNTRENAGGDFSWPQNPRWKFLQGRDTLPPGVTIPTPDCSAAPGTPAADRAALVALYNATGGANWTDNTNWLSTGPVGEWHGVTTNDDGRVTEIDLGENQLTGIVPTSLGDLSELTILRLFGNQLSGAIPLHLGNLSNLEVLALGGNELEGEIPSDLQKLSNLGELHLWGNGLTGTIPAWLGDLTDLTQLSISSNRMYGTIPAELGSLTSLTDLWLHDNELRGPIPEEMGNLTNLGRLELHQNNLTGTIPSSVGDLSQLTVLFLFDNQLTGEIPSSLGALTRLERLSLRDNQLSGEIPSWLGDLYNLKLLRLDGNDLDGEIPTELGNLSNLTFLRLDDNQLSGSIPEELGNLSNLTRLQLNDNNLMRANPFGAPKSQQSGVPVPVEERIDRPSPHLGGQSEEFETDQSGGQRADGPYTVRTATPQQAGGAISVGQ